MTEKFEEEFALPIKTWVLDCGFRGPDSDFAISEADALGLWWGSVDLERVSTITNPKVFGEFDIDANKTRVIVVGDIVEWPRIDELDILDTTNVIRLRLKEPPSWKTYGVSRQETKPINLKGIHNGPFDLH